MLVAPVVRCQPIAVLRRVAITAGPLPVRAWCRSSRKVTSRTWWRRLVGLVGALSVAAGLLILFRPAAGAVALAWIIGVYAIVAGVLMLAATWQLSHSPMGRGTGRPAAAGIRPHARRSVGQPNVQNRDLALS
ncbi:DUF308 domain-containing protein [Actinoplanes sp. NPDC051513]|uniref:DUF308 domain-containing protein n=1 Tax=Actinoplanes sp. NPDC051513 TaxID=3363908 RepID=UPI00378C5FC3